jgi:chemotaxis protein MotB
LPVNYAAARHLVPPPAPSASGHGLALPWEAEAEAEVASARQETWLLSFVDILALLLTLFVLLLAYQDRGPSVVVADAPVPQIDFSLSPVSLAIPGPAPLQPAAGARGFAMPGEGLLPVDVDREGVGPEAADQPAAPPAPLSAEPPAADGEAVTAEVAQAAAADQPADAGEAPVVAVSADSGEAQAVAKAASPLQPAPVAGSPADALLETLRHSELGERVEVTARPGAVSLEISDSILFTPASAALSAEGLVLLDQLAGVLRTLPYTLSVEGHTDNVPIHTRQYPSNWELSAARAAMVTRQLIEQGVAAERVRAIGYGATRPRSDNLTADGRAKNRRVTFVLQVESGPG